MNILRSPLMRAILVVLLLASIPVYVLQYTLVPLAGDFGVQGTYGDDWIVRVVSVEPGSSAARAGIRTGDTIALAPDQRAPFFAPARGQHVRVYVHRNGTARIVTLTAAPSQIVFGLAAAIRAAVVFFLLIFALLVAIRAWRTEYGPLIVALLTANVVSPAGDNWPIFLATPASMFLATAVRIVAELAGGFGSVLVIALCAGITHGRLRALRYLQYVAVADLVFMTGMGVVWGYPPFVGIVPQSIGNLLSIVFFAGELILPVAVVCAMFAATTDERAQVAWIFWGFFPYQCGVVLVNLNLLPNFPPTLFADPVFNAVARALELSLPVFLFYGLLVRRTIDIGFVINRVAVYGTISLAVLAVFVALEYLVGHYVEAHSVESWAFQLGIALVIGLMARYMHGAVDRFVDRVLFAKRHADESALRRFAYEAEAFASAAALLDRTLEAVAKHSDTRGAAIYLCGEDAATLTRGAETFPQRIAVDDPLLVALRRWNEPLDTHDADAATAFPDGMVFPMSARGRLIGVLACRTKRDATAFAPDEREPLADVARAVARALDALGAKQADSFDGLGQTVVSLLLSIQDAVTGLREGVR